jgi:hypothetical protein
VVTPSTAGRLERGLRPQPKSRFLPPGKLTEEQVRKLLGYGTRLQVDGFLKEHGVYLHYTLEHVDRDTETSREFSSR